MQVCVCGGEDPTWPFMHHLQATLNMKWSLKQQGQYTEINHLPKLPSQNAAPLLGSPGEAHPQW